MPSREAGAGGGAGVGGTEAGRRSHTRNRYTLTTPRTIERWMQRAERVITLAVGVGLGGALTYLLGFGRRTQQAEAYQREPSTAEPERSSWRPVGEKPVLGSRHMLRRLRRRDQKIDSEGGVYYNSADAPDWCQSLFSDSSQRYAPRRTPAASREQHARKRTPQSLSSSLSLGLSLSLTLSTSLIAPQPQPSTKSEPKPTPPPNPPANPPANPPPSPPPNPAPHADAYAECCAEECCCASGRMQSGESRRAGWAPTSYTDRAGAACRCWPTSGTPRRSHSRASHASGPMPRAIAAFATVLPPPPRLPPPPHLSTAPPLHLPAARLPHVTHPKHTGGAMTSLMDDLCGHICFVAAEAPWCGATVQVSSKSSKSSE